jgi:hypothetical protein
MKFLASGIMLLFASSNVVAATGSGSGTIQYVYTYGDGSVLVTGFAFPGASCNNNSGFYIESTHPHFARLMATILTAKASGQSIIVNAKIDNCWYPTITADTSTYIVLGP